MWKGAKNTLGYGLFKPTGAAFPRRAHRVSFEMHNDRKISPDQFVCHSCDTPACINPSHLFLGDAKINSNDARDKKRLVRKAGSASFGERHPKAFLKHEDIVAIRKSDCTVREIAAQFGMHVNSVRGIRSRRTWKHI